MTFAVGARPRGALNRNEFALRPTKRSSFPSPSSRPGARAPLNRNIFTERPGRHYAATAPRPMPVVVGAPWHARYPIFSRPAVILTGSWTPVVSLALAILGIGLLTSLCFPEAAPVIMTMSIALAITLLFLKTMKPSN